MDHVVLLGDSIFDNGRYVPGCPPVIEQLRNWLPRGWRATLLAVDGAIAEDIHRQLPRLPADASHLVISAGGNNALGSIGILTDESCTGAEMMAKLGQIQRAFRQEYQEMLRAVLAVQKPTVVCTIYDSIPDLDENALAALSLFNDVIEREAIRHSVPLLDLRFVCDEPRDYSIYSPIEPSEVGGAKIVQGIRRIVCGHDFRRGECVVHKK